MAAAKLDRSKPFGTISGDVKGRHFEQDGKFFAADGTQWTDPEAAQTVKSETAPATKPATAPVAKGKAKAEVKPAPEASADAGNAAAPAAPAAAGGTDQVDAQLNG